MQLYDKSRNSYGIPPYIKDKIDSPLGDEINIADALVCINNTVWLISGLLDRTVDIAGKMGGTKLQYLELGVSLGKTLYQVSEAVRESVLATIEVLSLYRSCLRTV